MSTTIKFTQESMKQMALFEKITRAKVKDCFEDTNNQLVFIVNQGELKKALGKQASTVKRLRDLFKRNIRIIEFNADVSEFIKNVARPIKLGSVESHGEIYTMIPPDVKSRGLLIGRNARVLRDNENIIKRYYQIDELKVQ